MSMIRLIHSICMGVRMDCFNAAAPMIVQNTATKLTVN